MHKICLFTDTLGDLNGVSRFIQDMGALAQEDSEIDLHIITCTSKTLPAEPYIHNLPYHVRVPMPFYQELDLVLPKKQTIIDILMTLQPDSVHISTPGPFGWVAKKIAAKMELPLIGTYHTDFPAYLHDLTGSDWIKKQTNKVMARFYASFTHVFSRSAIYATIMQTDLELPAEKISTLAPGTRLDHFHPKHQNSEVWSHFGLTPERLKVLYVGRINIEKSVSFLLQTWQILMQQNPQIKADLVLVGEGRYRKLSKKMRPFNVYMLGPVRGERLFQLYASADLFAFASMTDTLGQVIMEAQASQTPCLVSDVGGPQSLVKHQVNGRIVKKNNQQAWLEALQESLNNAQQLTDWGPKARQNMLNYDIQNSFKDFKKPHLLLTQKLDF